MPDKSKTPSKHFTNDDKVKDINYLILKRQQRAEQQRIINRTAQQTQPLSEKFLDGIKIG